MRRPILGPLIIARDMYHYHTITRLIFPIIKDRMADFQLGNDYKKPEYSLHNDYIHWALHHTFSQDDPIERIPEMITKRLVVLSFATIHSSVITITTALVDIASSPSSVEIQEGLREEVGRATTPQSSESWKTSNLVKMVRIDSVLRESMRLWGFISRGVIKMMTLREGIKIPSGEHRSVNLSLSSISLPLPGVHQQKPPMVERRQAPNLASGAELSVRIAFVFVFLQWKFFCTVG